jgi:hypothetical protein
MIRYALVCALDHGFEAWFGSSADYDDQAARGLLECPVCASTAVRKQIMAPAIAAGGRRDAPVDDPERAAPASEGDVLPPERQAELRAQVMEVMSQVRRKVEDNFDYVGDSFAKEARDIHEGRSEQRGIYGKATLQEVKALVDDGVPIAPLPPAPTPKARLN